MTFSEKLDFLMSITKTSNSALALYTSLDASHISRLRRGARNPAKKENYLKSMARYFAKQCNEDYQRISLSDVLKTGTVMPTDHAKIAKLIYQWFLDDLVDETKSVEGFLENLSHFQFKRAPQLEANDAFMVLPETENEKASFYGLAGKREAVLAFLACVLNQDQPRTLLLFSDEDLNWLSESREFAAKWAVLLSQVIMRGNKIKIIHTVNRNLDEMFSAIGEWLPIYITGAIEPYYYPKIRDGIFKRTLFIAPGTAAVMSTSIGNKNANAANFLIKDNKAIEALTQEYNDYLALCRPLMRIFTTENKLGYWETLSAFEKEEANSILKTTALSTTTMPTFVAEQIISRMGSGEKNKLLTYHQMRTQNFEKSLDKNKFYEIVNMPDLITIQNEEVRIAFSEMLDMADLFYTAEEFRLHLKNIVVLLQSFENYHVFLVNAHQADGCMLYAKEDIGILVAKFAAPAVVFAINETNMTAAFWDFLNDVTGKAKDSSVNRRTTIAKLEGIMEELKQSKVEQ